MGGIQHIQQEIQAASSSCARRTLLLLADRRGCKSTAGVAAHGDGTLAPLSAKRLATSSGRSAEFATVPGPHGSGPASAAEQGEIGVGSGGDGGGGGGGDGGDGGGASVEEQEFYVVVFGVKFLDVVRCTLCASGRTGRG